MSTKSLSFANPSAQYRSHRSGILEAIQGVLESDIYIHGQAHDAFERDFARFLGVRHVIGVASGTDALVISLLGAGVETGDRVVVPSHTAAATISAICMIGAQPVFVDVDDRSYVITPGKTEEAIEGAKAVVLVHLYGYPAEAAAFRAMANAHRSILIEDCAQATGAFVSGGQRAGTVGDAGCFSFFPTKNLGAIGDGGAIATNDDELAQRMRSLRTYGWDEERRCQCIGRNSRLDEIQAAILNVKLPALDDDNARRRAIAARYRVGLADLPLELPAEAAEGEHVYHLFVTALDHRDELRAHLGQLRVGTGIHYPVPTHLHPAFRPFVEAKLPVTERLASRILSLPMYPELTEDDVDSVISAIQTFF